MTTDRTIASLMATQRPPAPEARRAAARMVIAGGKTPTSTMSVDVEPAD